MRHIQTTEILDRPGYFGKRRDQILNEYAKQYGEFCFHECWQVDNMILDFNEAVMLYDDAYYHYLSNLFKEKLDWITSFSECYDSDQSNIKCGTTHDRLATPRHIQDVSVRRALIRLGTYFKNWKGYDPTLYKEEELLHIRGYETNGHWLMPGLVPFHKPELILPLTNVKRFPKWALENSVEAFWQANKVITKW